MKTHDLARALSQFARVLRESPNMELESLGRVFRESTSTQSAGGMAVNLATLAELARIDKSQWQHFISEYNFPIEVRPRDASRDILGKLLRYLEENPSALQRLRNRIVHDHGEASPELLRAFKTLLRDTATNVKPSQGNR